MDDKLKVLLTRALGTARFANVTTVGTDWMQASQVRPFFDADPALIWLNYYGALEGFYADDPPYSLAAFLAAQKRQFRDKWVAEMAPGAPSVCQASYDLYQADSLLATCQLMFKGVPVIVLPSLWYAGEKVFGKPDLIIRTTWLRDQLTSGRLVLADPETNLEELAAPAPALGLTGTQGHYAILNLVFSSHIEDIGAAPEHQANVAQARIQAYILGQLQGYMPQAAYFVGRAAPGVLTPVAILTPLDAPLDPKLAARRDQFIEIKLNGARYRPWRDAIVANNPKNQNSDERWARAKAAIARHPDSGGDLRLLPNVGAEQQAALASRGIPNLRSLLAIETADLPQQLTGIEEIGPKRQEQLRAILLAHRTQLPVLPPPEQLPPTREFEFYVDFEFFSNLNVDCEREWPVLAGRELVFMIGIGWQETGAWHSPPLIFRAKTESAEGERELFQNFIDFLQARTNGAYLDPVRTALYHWHSAEKTQVAGAAERQNLPADHPLRRLPWQDLRKVFTDGPAAVPGAWGFGVKEVAKALGHLDARYDPQWIGDLDNGLGAMLLGWRLYADMDKLATDKKLNAKKQAALKTHVREGWEVLESYLAADCQALWQILRWLRAEQAAPQVDPATAPYVGWDAVQRTFPAAPEQAYAGLNAGKGVVVYGQPVLNKTTGKLPVNHLLWGDELLVIETRGNWRKIRARGTVGWVHKSMIQPAALLEVNFVDVGQGDGCFIVTPDRKYLLVDAGPEDHLYRFLRWYFAHFKADVTFDAAIITHPDSDHYAGFGNFFDAKDPALKNVRFRRIYHNGIVAASSAAAFVTGVAADRAALNAALQNKGGNYHALLRQAIKSKRITTEPDGIQLLSAAHTGLRRLDGYEKPANPDDNRLEIQVLGPVPEDDAQPPRLRWYGDEGKTKNGNSIVLRLVYKDVSILLGGDLNVPAEEYLLAHYSQLDPTGEPVETREQRIASARRFLQTDIAKACHHGSGDFTTDFLAAVNPIVTVISSGDDESYSHPRPDTLGALGRFSRVDRPLIFSTELARSAPEQIKHPSELRQRLTAARLQEGEAEFAEDLIQELGRSVAVYGMICLRTDGRQALFAQKLEKPLTPAKKWDLHLVELGQ